MSTDHLPALKDGENWASGFRQIVQYLTSHSLCEDLDAKLDPEHRADGKAYSAFVSSHAGPLLDLSLYVSAANWAATTRPAYSQLLPFPLTWTMPPLIRHEAIKRAEHLGLAELDTDFDPNGGLHLSTGREHLPESFRRHLPVGSKKTVREEMTPEQKTAIRLFALTEDCLSVLEDLLSSQDGNPWLLGPTVSSLDCLAFGYLSLMHQAPVPRSFLREWMDDKSPRLVQYVREMRAECLDSPGALPTAPPAQRSFLGSVGQILDTAVLNSPGVGDYYASEMRHRAETGAKGLDRRALVLAMSLMVTGVAAGYGIYFYRTMPRFGARTQLWRATRGGSKLNQLGDLGFMLDSALGPRASPPAVANFGTGSGRLVDTDSEID